MERQYFGVQEGVVLEGINLERLMEGEVRDIVEELAIRYQKVPVEPSIDKRSGEVLKEEKGYYVQVDQIVHEVLTASPGKQIALTVHEVQPRHIHQELTTINQVAGRYATSIHGSTQRIHNIQVASVSINNTLLWPGESFSFNDTTGPRTAERGYLTAPIILKGSFDVGLGGGVCQVSSTLFNAALEAKLSIEERHPHSMPVHYVPKGLDATVDYGSLDLKFRNNRKEPVIIKMYVSDDQIMAEIWGENNK